MSFQRVWFSSVQSLSHVWLSVTPWTVHRILQARILEWVAFPFPGDLPNPGIKPRYPSLEADSLPAELSGKPFCGVLSYKFSSVQVIHSVVSNSLRPHELQHARHALSITNSRSSHKPCSSSWWCHPNISSSVVPFSSCPQSLPASGSFPMSQLFTCGGQSIGVSASVSVLPMNTQDWSPLGWTGWISLLSKGLSRVFSITTVQKHQLLGTQPFPIVQLSHRYMTTGKTLALTR